MNIPRGGLTSNLRGGPRLARVSAQTKIFGPPPEILTQEIMFFNILQKKAFKQTRYINTWYEIV